MAKARQNNVVSEAAVQEYELLNPLLCSLLTEMKELSKKKQDGVLNKLKVTMINKILERIRGLLEREPTSQFIALLDDETLPTNSDVVLILAQFQSAMRQYTTVGTTGRTVVNHGRDGTRKRTHRVPNPIKKDRSRAAAILSRCWTSP